MQQNNITQYDIMNKLELLQIYMHIETKTITECLFLFIFGRLQRTNLRYNVSILCVVKQNPLFDNLEKTKELLVIAF